MSTSYRPVSDGAAPMTIWHATFEDEDERHWFSSALREVGELHPATMTYLSDGEATTIALRPPLADETV